LSPALVASLDFPAAADEDGKICLTAGGVYKAREEAYAQENQDGGERPSFDLLFDRAFHRFQAGTPLADIIASRIAQAFVAISDSVDRFVPHFFGCVPEAVASMICGISELFSAAASMASHIGGMIGCVRHDLTPLSKS
jgi:hypothetical protein